MLDSVKPGSYDKLLDNIYRDMSEAERAEFDEYPGGKENESELEHQRRVADEWLARGAEDVNLEGSRSLWQAIKTHVKDWMRRHGMDVYYSDYELEDLIRKSYRKLRESASGRDGAPARLTDGGDGVRYRFTEDKEDFDKMLKEAAEKDGIVMPSLAEKEVKVVHGDINHPFDTSLPDTSLKKQVKSYAREHSDEMLGDIPVENGIVNVSLTSLGEMADPKSYKNTVKNGVSKDVHFAAIPKIKEIIRNSIDAEVHPDYIERDKSGKRIVGKYSDHILMHRLYGAVEIDGKVYRVKTTVKEDITNKTNRAHTYEVAEIELLESHTRPADSTSPISNNSISGANLLQGVEKSYDPGKKLLDESAKTTENSGVNFRVREDERREQTRSENFKRWFGDWENHPENSSKVVDENGEPLVVYHQTNSKRYINKETGEDWDLLSPDERDKWEGRDDWEDYWEEQDFYVFDDRKARQSVEVPGFFFSPEYDENHEYGERTIAAYLDMKNPAIDPDYSGLGYTDTAGLDLMNKLIAQGYDGIINTEDGVPYEYIVFRPEQIKSATDNNGDFSRENPDIRYRLRDDERKPTFYSNAERAVEGVKQEQATGEQWKAMHSVDVTDAMRESVEQGQPLFRVRGEKDNAARERLEKEGLETSDDGDIRFSYRYPLDDKRRKKSVDDIVLVTGVTRRRANQWLNNVSSLTSYIFGDPESYANYTPDDRYKAIKNNSDYPQGTVDFNNICPKRKDFTAIWSILQHENPDRIFTAEDLETIRQTMIDDGYDVACGLCFVEGRRKFLGEIAQQFIDGMKNGTLKPEVKNILGDETYVPTIDELLTTESSDKLRAEHPQVYDAFVRMNNARGMQAGRLYENYAEYKREILDWDDRKVKAVNDAGGLRIFSFSDFEATHLLDIIQIISDCAARGVKIQGYTKVPSFAKAVRNTGIKLNRSLIPAGTGIKEVDGKKVLDYDTTEGIDINDPDFLDEIDNPNIGNILVGISDEHIRLAMVDPFVDYIIGYHASGIGENLRKMKGIDHWVDYTKTQSDRDLKTGKKADKQINIYTDVLQAAEAEGKPITNKREFVEKFLEVAKERGLEPRFSQFLDKDADGNYVYTEGYHKFLIDFKLFDKDGNIVPQEVVRPDFDLEYCKQILDDYAKGAKVEKDYSPTLAKLREKFGLPQPEGSVRFSVRNNDKETEKVSGLSDKQLSLQKNNENELPERISQGEQRAQDAQVGSLGEAAVRLSESCGALKADARRARGTLSAGEERLIEEREAERQSKADGTWVPYDEIYSIGRMGPSGNESDTYISDDGWIYKENHLMHGYGVLGLLNQAALHNLYFPETSYTLHGFTGFDGRSIYPILRQRYVPNAEHATQSEIDAYMDRLGFERTGEGKFTNGVHEISDVLPKNVLRDKDGDLYVVDAEFAPAKVDGGDHRERVEDARRRLEDPEASEFEKQAAMVVLRAYGGDTPDGGGDGEIILVEAMPRHSRLRGALGVELLEGFAHLLASGGGVLLLNVGEDGSHVFHLGSEAAVAHGRDDFVHSGFLGQVALQDGHLFAEFGHVASCLLECLEFVGPGFLHLLEDGDFFRFVEVLLFEAFAGLELEELGFDHLEDVESVFVFCLHCLGNVAVDLAV